MPSVTLLGSNNEDRTLTVRVDGKTYEYYFRGDVNQVMRDFKVILSKSPGKALNWIKDKAYKEEEVRMGFKQYVKEFTDLPWERQYSPAENKEINAVYDAWSNGELARDKALAKLKSLGVTADDANGLLEDAPTNNVGSGNVAGVDKPFSPKPFTRKTFANSAVFEVDDDHLFKSRFGKHPRHRYSTYVGNDELGQAIREYGRANPKKAIILRHAKTGAMIYLKGSPLRS
jgi:hypothetical protein